MIYFTTRYTTRCAWGCWPRYWGHRRVMVSKGMSIHLSNAMSIHRLYIQTYTVTTLPSTVKWRVCVCVCVCCRWFPEFPAQDDLNSTNWGWERTASTQWHQTLISVSHFFPLETDVQRNRYFFMFSSDAFAFGKIFPISSAKKIVGEGGYSLLDTFFFFVLSHKSILQRVYTEEEKEVGGGRKSLIYKRRSIPYKDTMITMTPCFWWIFGPWD